MGTKGIQGIKPAKNGNYTVWGIELTVNEFGTGVRWEKETSEILLPNSIQWLGIKKFGNVLSKQDFFDYGKKIGADYITPIETIYLEGSAYGYSKYGFSGSVRYIVNYLAKNK